MPELIYEDQTGLLGIAPHWERVRLGAIGSVLNGYPFDANAFSESIGTPLARIRDVLAGVTETRFDGPFDPAYLLNVGDLLVGMDGEFHCARWRGGVALLNQRVCRIEVGAQFYETGLLDHLLPGYLKAVHQHTSSVTVKHLSSRTIEALELPLPPRAEQSRLVEKLDELALALLGADKELAIARRKLSLYQQSLLASAIDGVAVTVEECCNVTAGFAFSSQSFSPSGTPVVKIANVGHGHFLDEAAADCLDPGFESSHPSFLVKGGDVLVALTRPVTNDQLKSCMYPSGRQQAFLNQRVAALRPRDPTLGKYIYYATRSNYFRDQISGLATQTLQPNVSPFALRRIKLPLPPAREARIVAQALDDAFVRVSSVAREINRAQELVSAQRQNILRAAFSGQLVPQDPNDEPASVMLERIRASQSSAAPAKTKAKARGRVKATAA